LNAASLLAQGRLLVDGDCYYCARLAVHPDDALAFACIPRSLIAVGPNRRGRAAPGGAQLNRTGTPGRAGRSPRGHRGLVVEPRHPWARLVMKRTPGSTLRTRALWCPARTKVEGRRRRQLITRVLRHRPARRVPESPTAADFLLGP